MRGQGPDLQLYPPLAQTLGVFGKALPQRRLEEAAASVSQRGRQLSHCGGHPGANWRGGGGLCRRGQRRSPEQRGSCPCLQKPRPAVTPTRSRGSSGPSSPHLGPLPLAHGVQDACRSEGGRAPQGLCRDGGRTAGGLRCPGAVQRVVTPLQSSRTDQVCRSWPR